MRLRSTEEGMSGLVNVKNASCSVKPWILGSRLDPTVDIEHPLGRNYIANPSRRRFVTNC